MKQQKEDPAGMISDHDFWQSILDGLDEEFVTTESINLINSSEVCQISPDRSWAVAEQQREFQDHGKKLMGNDCELVAALSDPSQVLEPNRECSPKDHPHAHAEAHRNLVPANEDYTNSDIELTEAVGNLKVEGNALIEGTPELNPLIFQNLDFCSLPRSCSIEGGMPTLPTTNSITGRPDPRMWNVNPETLISCHDNNMMERFRCNSAGEIDRAGQVNELMMGASLPDQLAGNINERMGGGLCCDQFQGYSQGYSQNSSGHQKLLSISGNLLGRMTAKHCIDDEQGPSSSNWSRLDQLMESRQMNAAIREAAVSPPLNHISGPVERNNTNISYSELSLYFNMPITQAARELKVGLTVLKKKCREFGIPRWPHRKMKSLQSLIHNIQELAKNNGGLSQARLSNAIEILEEQKKVMEESPGTELAERTKRLRQACFKANYKKRRQMLGAGQVASNSNNSDTGSSSNQVTVSPPQLSSTCSSISR